MEKGIGRKKVTERTEGWWSKDVERLIVIRKMTCRRFREARQTSGRGYTEPTRGELQKSERGSEKGYHEEEEEGIKEENSEEDQRAGGTSCKPLWTNLRGKRMEKG